MAASFSRASLAELQRGLARHDPIRRARLDVLLSGLRVVAFDAAAAEAYGRVIVACGWIRGRDFDRMIAGHALSRGDVLVTNNIADFRDIPGLIPEDWTTPT